MFSHYIYKDVNGNYVASPKKVTKKSIHVEIDDNCVLDAYRSFAVGDRNLIAKFVYSKTKNVVFTDKFDTFASAIGKGLFIKTMVCESTTMYATNLHEFLKCILEVTTNNVDENFTFEVFTPQHKPIAVGNTLHHKIKAICNGGSA